MWNLDENTITAEVLSRLQNTDNPRLKQIMTGLIRHLHEFAREVELTEEEWFEGVKFLTDTGRITDDKRQEFVLLSDTLGLSMLVIAQNNRKPKVCTEATVFGPFHKEGAPRYALGDDIANGAKGEPCYVNARVVGLGGEPIAGALVEVQTDEQGLLYFRTILPVAYPIPSDGPVGRMLQATGRHPWRPAHIHFMIEAPGYEKLVTHVFRDADQYLRSDTVFGVRSSLIAHYQQHPAGETTPAVNRSDVPFYTLNFDFVLNPSSKVP
jgi:hydroxyquinol 1,2-dioxygenase